MTRQATPPLRTFDASQSPAARPLSLLRSPELDTCFRRALAEADGALGAHCIHELWMRGEFATNIEAALATLWQHASESIPEWLPMRYVEWLPLAYEVALGFREEQRGRYNIYMVLLDFGDRRRGPHGLYVGMTQYSPAERFDQHKAGIHAAGSVLKRGLELLAGPTLHLQRMARGAALYIESQLAEGLRDAGLLVEGGH